MFGSGVQDLSWDPGRKAGVGQSWEGLGKHLKEIESTMHFTGQTGGTRGAEGKW